jgi:hypothetical protein
MIPKKYRRFVSSIEAKTEVKMATKVLIQLSKKGLNNPCIASGWIRGWITKTQPTDIDIQFSGPIPRIKAPKILEQTLTQLKLDKSNWDIKGIWNIQEWSGIENIEEYYRLFFVDSIDSIYLASDGKLHDPTGHGIADAANKILRMNDFAKATFPYRDEDIVYLCLRGCEKVARNHWKPTPNSIKLIEKETYRWEKLSPERQKFLVTDYLIGKFKPEKLGKAKKIYSKFGWGFVFPKTP